MHKTNESVSLGPLIITFHLHFLFIFFLLSVEAIEGLVIQTALGTLCGFPSCLPIVTELIFQWRFPIISRKNVVKPMYSQTF